MFFSSNECAWRLTRVCSVDGTGMPQTPGMAPAVAKQIGPDGVFQLGAFGVAVVSDLELAGEEAATV